MKERSFQNWIIWGLALAAVLNVWRLYAQEAALAYWKSPEGAGRPVGEAFEGYATLATMVPEDHRPHLRRGARLLGAARESTGEEAARALRELAGADYRRAAEKAPGDGEALLGLAYAAEAYRRPKFAKAAYERSPADPAYLWAWARSLAPTDSKREGAYRQLTTLAPALTPRVLDELGVRLSTSDGKRFVGGTQTAYRYWAWSVTDASIGMRIAKFGLAQSNGSTADTAWLHYLIGLRSMDERPAVARTHLEKATRLLPGEQAFQRNYGFALLRGGRETEAREAFEASIRLRPNIGNPAYLGLAQALEHQGETRRAKRLYERLSKNPRLESWVRRKAGDGLYRIQKESR